MASESEIEPPQTQSQSSEIDTNGWGLSQDQADVWGRLKAIPKIGINDYDLSSDTFTAGRSKDSSCIFSVSLSNKLLLQTSKTHFKLTKDLKMPTNPVYIEDCSRNGTYVNGLKLGLGNIRILNHNDTIAIVGPKWKIFSFQNTQRPSFELPSEINKLYHVSKLLGSGACGSVFMVYDYDTCIPYALKRIQKHGMIKKDRVKDEGEIMKATKHPCVVKMYGVREIGDSIYITLELMKGGELLSRITRNKYLEEDTSKLFFYQMCHAIKHLHDRKITHRDLKPDNILLSDSSDPNTLIKISDFGLSKLCPNNSLLTTMCGTAHYVAPEVLETLGHGKPKYDKKCDIWSLGVVLYTCLSGTLPFSNEYGSPATEQIRNGVFQFRSKVWEFVSPMAKQLICEMLTVNPARRPSIDQVLNHTWINNYELKSKAHKIMGIAAPPRPAGVNIFAVPYTVEEIRPTNDQMAQPIKKRRIN